MKTITLTIPENAKITVDGVEYPTSTEVKLWTPRKGDSYSWLNANGVIGVDEWGASTTEGKWLKAGNVRPTREYAEALDRKRRAESIIFRYFYERGIDTRWKKGGHRYGAYLIEDDGIAVDLTIGRHNFGSPFYVESKEIAEQAIADIPDAIRTALMGGWV